MHILKIYLTAARCVASSSLHLFNTSLSVLDVETRFVSDHQFKGHLPFYLYVCQYVSCGDLCEQGRGRKRGRRQIIDAGVKVHVVDDIYGLCSGLACCFLLPGGPFTTQNRTPGSNRISMLAVKEE